MAVARSLHKVGNILDGLVSAAGPKKGIFLGIVVLGHTTLFPLHGGNMRMGAAPLVSLKIRTDLSSQVILTNLWMEESTILSGGTAIDSISAKLLESSTFRGVGE